MKRDEDFWTRSNRVTKVTRAEIRQFDTSRFPVPDLDEWDGTGGREWLRDAILRGDKVWQCLVYSRTGFDAERSSYTLHYSRSDAEAELLKHPVGSEIDPMDFLRPEAGEFDPQKLSIETEISVLGRGEVPYFLVYEALEGAGVIDNKWRTSARVLSWIGRAGGEALKARFGENWEAVAQLEYCVKHFSPTSLATLAARAQVGDFIATHQFDAGYASRELEMVLGGAEEIATNLMQVRHKAGEEGGKASRARRLQNLNLLIDEIEALSSAVDLISEDRIVDQAFDSVKKKYSEFPRSTKTRLDYETTLRSEEPFKSRYDAVFHRNA